VKSFASSLHVRELSEDDICGVIAAALKAFQLHALNATIVERFFHNVAAATTASFKVEQLLITPDDTLRDL
jgi:hypothetical protein